MANKDKNLDGKSNDIEFNDNESIIDITTLSKGMEKISEQVYNISEMLNDGFGGMAKNSTIASNNMKSISDFASKFTSSGYYNSVFKTNGSRDISSRDRYRLEDKIEQDIIKDKKRELSSNAELSNRQRKSLEKEITDLENQRNLRKKIEQQREKLAQAEIDALSRTNKDGSISKYATNKVLEERAKLEELEKIEQDKKANDDIVSHFKDLAVKVIDTTLHYFEDAMKRGINNAVDFYNKNYTEIAGKTGLTEHNVLQELTSAYRDTNYGRMVNINNELKPMLLSLSQRGLRGEELEQASITASIDKKVMPWLDQTSQQWVHLISAVDKSTLENIKGMQLQLQESKHGNMLLQSGVMANLLSEMSPLIASIDKNVFLNSDKQLLGEYTAVMEELKRVGVSESDAYSYVQKLMSADKNAYLGLTGGDTFTKLYLMGRQSGMGATYGLDVSKQLSAMGSTDNISVGAISAILGNILPGGWATVSTANQMLSTDTSLANKNAERYNNEQWNREKYRDKTTKDALKGYTTATNNLINALENLTAGLGDSIARLPASDLITKLIGMISISTIITKGFKTILGGGNPFSGIKGFADIIKGTKTFSDTSKILNVGNLLAKGTMSGTALGIGGIVAGLSMAGFDAYKGVNKANEWGVGKLNAGISGALFGTDDIGLKNTLKQAGKYGAIGAGIGTLVGGPVGTLVGGAIGAGVGGLTSLFSGESVAKYFNDRKIEKQQEKQYEIDGSKLSANKHLENIYNLLKSYIGDKNKKETSQNINDISYNPINNIATITPNNYLNRAIQTNTLAYKKDNIYDKQQSDEEFKKRVIEVIVDANKSIVQAINDNGIDYENNLLPSDFELSRMKSHKDIINFSRS